MSVQRDAIRTARRWVRSGTEWPVARARGNGRKGGRAAGIWVERRQGRGVGQACAGVWGEFARIAGVGRGESGENEEGRGTP
jgi:hypothetical protein